MRSDEGGQALVEFALGLPLLLIAAFFALALLDATATQASLDSAAQRAATVLASTNDEAQAIGAASRYGWTRGQPISATFDPGAASLRCAGTKVTLTLSGSGHLGFLIPVATRITATQRTTIETNGAQAQRCAG